MAIPCPNCGSEESSIKDTRTIYPNRIQRRRLCDNCGQVFITQEMEGDFKTTSSLKIYIKDINQISLLDYIELRNDILLNCIGISLDDLDLTIRYVDFLIYDYMKKYGKNGKYIIDTVTYNLIIKTALLLQSEAYYITYSVNKSKKHSSFKRAINALVSEHKTILASNIYKRARTKITDKKDA